MKPLLVILFAFTLAGCKSSTKVPDLPPIHRPDASLVVPGQAEKDKSVVGSANRIDGIAETKAPAAAPEIRVETDLIRKAVQDNPAAAVELLVAQFQRALDLHEAQSKQMQETIKLLQKQIDDLKDAELKKQIATFRWAGFALIALAVGLFFAKQVEYAAAAGVIGMLALGLAQLFSQPWFAVALQISAALAAIGLGWAIFHAYRKRTLAEKVANEADRFKATLPKVVKVLDDAYDAGDAAVRDLLDRHIFSNLSQIMDRPQKDVIHDTRKML